MDVQPLAIPDVKLIPLRVHDDHRGRLYECYRADLLAAAGIATTFVQDNHSSSRRGVVRGLHAQIDPHQAKLIRVTRGAVLDVAVDIRPGSPTLGQHVRVTLTHDEPALLYIPGGFAHGFRALTEPADIHYKVDVVYDPSREVGIAYNDAELGIDWGQGTHIVSERDARLPSFRAAVDALAVSG